MTGNFAEILGAVLLLTGFMFGLYMAAIVMGTIFFIISGSWLLLVGIAYEKRQN